MLRIIALTLGILLAAWGGVITYRAFFLEPSATAVLNTASGEVHQYPDLLRATLGLVMLVGGACIAFFAARRKPM
jgi:predicted aminopeptidase